MPSLLLYAASMDPEAAPIVGDGAWDLPPLALDGLGSAALAGAGTWDLPPLAVAGVGAAPVPGTGAGAWTLPPLAMGGAGSARVAGDGAWTLPALGMSGAGTITPPVVGTGAWALPATAMGGAGSARVAGDGAWTLPALVLWGRHAVAASETFLAALRTRLRSLPGLADLRGVYLTTTPPGAAYPALVINRLWQSPFVNSSDSYYKEVAVQFTVLSLDDREATDLGDAAFDALFPGSGTPEIGFLGGYEMTRLPGMSHGPVADPSGMISGDLVWRYSFDFTWMIGKG